MRKIVLDAYSGLGVRKTFAHNERINPKTPAF